MGALVGVLLAPPPGIGLSQPHRIGAHTPQIAWLQSQQASSGLVDSYEGDGEASAYTYDQALATISFTHSGHLQEARNILVRMALLQQSDGAWAAGYFTDGTVASAATSTGHNVWMSIALNYYEAATRDTTYLGNKRRVLGLLVSRTDSDVAHETYGAIRFADGSGSFSTEHNHDAYSAFRCAAQLSPDATSAGDYRDRANLILDYLRTEMWAPSPASNGPFHNVDVFWAGWNDFAWCTDPQTLGVLSLGPVGPAGEGFYGSLDWLYFNPSGSTRYQMDFDALTTDVDGFGFCTAPPAGVWIEGTESAVCAFAAVDSLNKASYFRLQMNRVPSPNGGIIYSFSETNPAVLRYPENWRYPSVAATAWFYFAQAAINPFNIDSWVTAAEEIPIASGARLFQSHPNPSSPPVQIAYELRTTGPARVEVFDPRGTLVRVLVASWRAGGVHRVSWDGRDDQGRPMPAGLYFYRLMVPELRVTKKLVLLR